MDAFACFSCSFFSLLCCFYCAFKPVLFSALSRLEEESSAFYSSSRLWDDGIILPQDTRKVGFPFRPFYSPVSQGVNMTHSRLAMCWFQTWGCHFSLHGIHLCNSHPVSPPLVYPKFLLNSGYLTTAFPHWASLLLYHNLILHLNPFFSL